METVLQNNCPECSREVLSPAPQTLDGAERIRIFIQAHKHWILHLSNPLKKVFDMEPLDQERGRNNCWEFPPRLWTANVKQIKSWELTRSWKAQFSDLSECFLLVMAGIVQSLSLVYICMYTSVYICVYIYMCVCIYNIYFTSALRFICMVHFSSFLPKVAYLAQNFSSRVRRWGAANYLTIINQHDEESLRAPEEGESLQTGRGDSFLDSPRLSVVCGLEKKQAWLSPGRWSAVRMLQSCTLSQEKEHAGSAVFWDSGRAYEINTLNLYQKDSEKCTVSHVP